MKHTRVWTRRLIGLFARRRRDGELAAEIESHLQLHIDDNLRAGMMPDEARRAALVKLGGIASLTEAYHDRGTVPALEHLLRDARFAMRQLRRSPGFTATAVLMLGLGIGTSVAIFAFVDATLIKPLPYADSSRLVGVFGTTAMFPRSNVSYPDYLDLKRQSTAFSALEVYRNAGFLLTTPSGAEPARVVRVSDGFFRLLGVAPILGRDFRAGEDLAGAAPIVILSHATWQRRFGGAPDVLGRTVTLNGEPHAIVGVMPRSFHFAPSEPTEFWTPMRPGPGCDLNRGCHASYGVARLKDGVSLQAARAEMTSLAKQLERQFPDSNRDQGLALTTLTEALVGEIRPILLMLLIGAVLLLSIASVNVASLLLVRSESRRREIAVRNALGASTSRLVSQFVTEGAILVLGGAVLGLAAASWVLPLLTRLIPEPMFARMTYLHGLGLNPRVLAFAAIVSLAATVLFSITPSLRLSLFEMRDGLAEGSRGSAGRTWHRLGARLVVLELILAMVLLVGAGLLGKSLYRLLNVDIGFRPDALALINVAAPRTGYEKIEQTVALRREIERRVAALPGVQSVGTAVLLPIGGNGNTMWFRIIGRPHHGEHNETPQREVSPNWFRTLGATLVRGRDFTEADDMSKPLVAIVNQALVRRYFANEEAIGQQLTYLNDRPVPIEIVGIVQDLKEGPLNEPTPPVLYIPLNQSTDRAFAVVARTASDPEALPATLAAVIREIDPGIVASRGTTMDRRIHDSFSAYLQRSSAWLVGGFAGVAFLLAVVGLYGVVAYSVSHRRREIGVRMALGAHRRSVCRLVLKEAGWLTAVGIGLGLICAVAAASLMRGLLFGVTSWDLSTLAAVAIVLGLAALAASYVPARRAASVNPVDALRSE